MAEPTPNSDPQGATPNGSPPTPAMGKPGQGATPEPLSHEDALKELESLKAQLSKVNNESKEHRLKAKELDELKKQIELEKLNETERLQKQYADLQSQHTTATRAYQERIVRYEVERVAASLGIIDTDAAVKLIDWSELKHDDDGVPENAKELLEKLLKEKPYLAGKATPTQQQGNPRIPAMNPGRSQIASPTRGQPGRLPRLTDPGIFVPPGTAYRQQ